MQNKDEPHLLPLVKKSRHDLKAVIAENLKDNLTKLITALKLREVLNYIVDSVLNWVDDNADLRAYKTEQLMVVQNGQTAFVLAHSPVNPEHHAFLFVEGIQQVYGKDFTVTGDVLTFIPGSAWQLVPGYDVVLHYRYFATTGGNGGNSGGSNGDEATRIKKFTIGNGQDTVFVIANPFTNTDVLIQGYKIADGVRNAPEALVIAPDGTTISVQAARPRIETPDSTTIKVTFDLPPPSNSYRILVIGT